jgi:putative intracellular protease/amidase
MKNRTCYVFVFDGFADWEAALAIVGLQQFTDVEVKTFGVEKKIVTSMGNIKVAPDLALADVVADRVSMLILPGGDAWDKGLNKEILPLVTELNEKQIPVAAICGATSFLAQHAFLDERPHTSNHLDYYLKPQVPTYKGEQYYQKQPCVTDGNLITANGTATVPFAEAIFSILDVLGDEHLQFWFNFFRHPEMTTA